MTGTRPSINHEVGDRGELVLLHPVENVPWESFVNVLTRYGLKLPTEAQLEYAIRGGTSTTWWTGEDAVNHAPSENVLSEHDPYFGHAPVGSFDANLFGLFDVVGNVWELTAERLMPYTIPTRPGDGLRRSPTEEKVGRAIRGGGGFDYDPHEARSSMPNAAFIKLTYYNLGARPIRLLTKAS